MVIAFNKWDLVGEERATTSTARSNATSCRCSGRPASRHRQDRLALDRLVPAVEKALAGLGDPISTGQPNSFLGRLVAEHPHPVRSGKQPKIMFGTQAASAPPTFVLFTSGRSRPATSAT